MVKMVPVLLRKLFFFCVYKHFQLFPNNNHMFDIFVLYFFLFSPFFLWWWWGKVFDPELFWSEKKVDGPHFPKKDVFQVVVHWETFF